MRVNLSSLSRVFLFGAFCLAGACASGGGGGGGGLTRRDQNQISPAEIEQARAAGVRDLRELVERLRPRWLQIRTERSFQLETVVLVYQNDSRLGNTDVLRGFQLAGVTSLRYLDSAQAGLLPGAGVGSVHAQGAIVISTSNPRDLSP